MAQTEVDALVVQLRADLATFRAEMVQGQKIAADASSRMEKSMRDMSDATQSSLGNISGAISGAFSLLKAGGAVAVALKLTKEALDLTFEAENVKAINSQFQVLATNAGLAGTKLADGLMKAADGLIDDTDLLKTANRAIVEMGASAGKLPELMEIAHKATAVMGGDLAQNFDLLTHAIAAGQTRALKNLGIIVDQDAAYFKLAQRLGLTVSQLNEAEKQQAILNAVLEKGSAAFSGITANVKANQEEWQRLKVSLSQIGEASTLAFDRQMGPAIGSVIGWLNKLAQSAKTELVSAFGEGTDQAKANVEKLRAKVEELDAASAKVRENDKHWWVPGFLTESALKAGQQQREKLEIEMEDAMKAIRAADNAAAQAKKSTGAPAAPSKQARLALEEQKKLYEEGAKLAENAGTKDPEAKYERELAAIDKFYGARGEMDATYWAVRNQIETEHTDATNERLNKEIEDLRTQNQYMAEIDQERYATKIAENQKMMDQLVAQQLVSDTQALKIAAERAKKEREIQYEKMDAMATSLKNFGELAKLFGKEGFEAYKAMSVASAVISGYEGVAKAIAKVELFPFNFVLAASVAAATAAQVANINATQLAKGIDSVPGIGHRDQFPAMLAPGERVVPKQTNKDLTSMIKDNQAMVELLSDISGKLNGASDRSPIVVQVGSKVIIDEVNEGIRSGRRLAVG